MYLFASKPLDLPLPVCRKLSIKKFALKNSDEKKKEKNMSITFRNLLFLLLYLLAITNGHSFAVFAITIERSVITVIIITQIIFFSI